MGACCSGADKVQPQEVHKFKQFGADEREASGVVQKTRSCTDVFFFIFMVACLITLIGLIIYCVTQGDIYRVINGCDHCGYVCGRKNEIINNLDEQSTCLNGDQTGNSFLLVRKSKGKNVTKECVANCKDIDGYKSLLTRCVPVNVDKATKFFSTTALTNFFQETAEDLHICWRELIYLCLIALGFSAIIMLLFRFFVGIVVWVLLVAGVIASIGGTVYLWITYSKIDSDQDYSGKRTSYLVLAIIATVVTVCIVLIIFALRKRISLVVQLFKEAGKALTAMPVLLLEPLLTFASLAIVIFLWFYFCLWIQSSGKLTMRGKDNYFYDKGAVEKITRWYNVFVLLWMIQFVIGCQHMVTAGAVATWYFTRDKSRLSTPIIRSFHNLIVYHLGSVALGSFLIAIVQFIRLILKSLQYYLKDRAGSCAKCMLTCCHCCFACFESVLQFISRNAYIEVAMHGYSFCRGGKQAYKLLVDNGLRVIVINSVGDFVLFLGKLVVVMATILLGIELLKGKEGLQHMWVPLAIAGLFSYFVVHCCLTVYEMAIDTIFLCFCEDCEENDGINRPYYMSRGLMEFVENSKKVLAYLENGIGSGRSQAWQHRPTTISDKVDQ